MAKRQRSKAELLACMKTYKALQADAESKDPIQAKTVYWRMGVEWCTVLWIDFKFSANELAKFTKYIADNDVTNMTEDRRLAIDEKLKAKGVEWGLKNSVPEKIKTNNSIDSAIADLMFYNTKATVDYSLLACEYLIERKGFGNKRLSKAIGSVYCMDALDARAIWQARKDLFERKGIWIELSEVDNKENAIVI